MQHLNAFCQGTPTAQRGHIEKLSTEDKKMSNKVSHLQHRWLSGENLELDPQLQAAATDYQRFNNWLHDPVTHPMTRDEIQRMVTRFYALCDVLDAVSSAIDAVGTYAENDLLAGEQVG